MKAPKILSASIRYAGGEAVAVLELELDPSDALDLGRHLTAEDDDPRLAPIAELVKARAEAEVPTTPTPVEE